MIIPIKTAIGKQRYENSDMKTAIGIFQSVEKFSPRTRIVTM